MSVLYVLIPLALLFSTGAVGWFIWSVRQGQLDELSSPPWRALHDAPLAPSLGGSDVAGAPAAAATATPPPATAAPRRPPCS